MSGNEIILLVWLGFLVIGIIANAAFKDQSKKIQRKEGKYIMKYNSGTKIFVGGAAAAPAGITAFAVYVDIINKNEHGYSNYITLFILTFAALAVFRQLSSYYIEFDEKGLYKYSMFGKKIGISWNEVIDVGYNPKNGKYNLKAEDGRTIKVTSDLNGRDLLEKMMVKCLDITKPNLDSAVKRILE